LAAVNQEFESALASERAARGARMPSLGVGANFTQYADAPALVIASPGLSFQSPRVFDNDNSSNRFAELKLPLYAGGSIGAAVRAASATRRAAESEQVGALASLKLDVAERFVDVLRTRSSVEYAAAQVAALRSHLRDVEVMTETGAVSRSDLLASKVALANAEQQRLRTVSAAAQARAAYNRRLGRPLDREPDLAPQVRLADDIAINDLAVLQARAARGRSEIMALSARADALHAQSRAELGRLLPQVDAVAGYTHFEATVLDRQDFTMVGVGVSWRLFDGGQTRNRAAALRRAGQALELRKDDLQNAIQMEVQQLWLGVNEAEGRIAATRDAVDQAEENLRISRELYAAQLIANTQVLDAVALQLSAAANARDAVLDATLARLRLLRAVGAL
jgi:outer membrane protein TolC